MEEEYEVTWSPENCININKREVFNIFGLQKDQKRTKGLTSSLNEKYPLWTKLGLLLTLSWQWTVLSCCQVDIIFGSFLNGRALLTPPPQWLLACKMVAAGKWIINIWYQDFCRLNFSSINSPYCGYKGNWQTLLFTYSWSHWWAATILQISFRWEQI